MLPVRALVAECHPTAKTSPNLPTPTPRYWLSPNPSSPHPLPPLASNSRVSKISPCGRDPARSLGGNRHGRLGQQFQNEGCRASLYLPVDIYMCICNTYPCRSSRFINNITFSSLIANMAAAASSYAGPAADWSVPLWVDGQQVKSAKTFDVVSPLTNTKLFTAAAASVDDCNAAVAAAQKAFPAWSKTKPSVRRDLLLKAADEMVKRKDELWFFANKEVASTEPYFAFDFSDALEATKSTAGLIASASAQGFVPEMLDENRSAMVVKESYGVVVAITPWNCPCILGLRGFLGPLASESRNRLFVRTHC